MIRSLLLLMLLPACSSAAPRPSVVTPIKSDAITGNVESALIENHVTLVDFWSESCAACIVVAGHVAVAIANDDRIIIRKVDIGDGTTDVALRYRVGTLPHWKIYDTRKRLRYQLIGSEVLRAPGLARELLTEP